VRQFDPATRAVTTFAGILPGADGIGVTVGMGPQKVTTDGTHLYVADSAFGTIRKVVIATGEVTTLAGSAGVLGEQDGVGTAASFASPAGITTDGARLFVTDCGNHNIRQVVIATGEVTTIAGDPGYQELKDGTGTEAHFHCPNGITTDGTHLYVADNINHAIRKVVIATGEVTTLAGSTTSGHQDGTAPLRSSTSPRA